MGFPASWGKTKEMTSCHNSLNDFSVTFKYLSRNREERKGKEMYKYAQGMDRVTNPGSVK